MRRSDIERFKDRLLEMQSRLAEQIGEIGQALAEDIRAAGDLSNVPTHPADHDTEGLEKELAVAESEGQILEQVEGALERIENGTFGRCQDCGAEISAERLDAVPYAAYCIKCQRSHEAGSFAQTASR